MLIVNHNQQARKILNDAEIACSVAEKNSFLINKLGFDVHLKKAGQTLNAFWLNKEIPNF